MTTWAVAVEYSFAVPHHPVVDHTQVNNRIVIMPRPDASDQAGPSTRKSAPNGGRERKKGFHVGPAHAPRDAYLGKGTSNLRFPFLPPPYKSDFSHVSISIQSCRIWLTTSQQRRSKPTSSSAPKSNNNTPKSSRPKAWNPPVSTTFQNDAERAPQKVKQGARQKANDDQSRTRRKRNLNLSCPSRIAGHARCHPRRSDRLCRRLV